MRGAFPPLPYDRSDLPDDPNPPPSRSGAFTKIGLGVLGALALVPLGGCVQTQPSQPAAPESSRVKDAQGREVNLAWSDGGPAVALNNGGQFVAGGAKGAVIGQVMPWGGVQVTPLKDAQGHELHLTWSDGHAGGALNNQGQFLLVGSQGAYFGQVRDHVAHPIEGFPSLGWSDSGLGATLNDRGQFLVTGSKGTVVGQIRDGKAEWRPLTNAAGRSPDLGWSESGVGAALTDDGQFLLAGSKGVVSGQVGADGRVQLQALQDVRGWVPDSRGEHEGGLPPFAVRGGIVSLGWSDSGVGVSMNNRGEFVMSGSKGTLVGRMENGRVAARQSLDLALSWSDGATGVAINNDGVFLVSGAKGTAVGQITDGQATYHLIQSQTGHDLSLSWSDGGAGVSLNDNGEFLITGAKGTVQGKINDGQVFWPGGR